MLRAQAMRWVRANVPGPTRRRARALLIRAVQELRQTADQLASPGPIGHTQISELRWLYQLRDRPSWWPYRAKLNRIIAAMEEWERVQGDLPRVKEATMPRFEIVTESAFWAALPPRTAEPAEVLQRNDTDRQLVVGWRIRDSPMLVKVYSTVIGPCPKGRSDPASHDAIRVSIVDTHLGRGVGKTRHVQRTPGWERRLSSRVQDAILEAHNEADFRQKHQIEHAPSCPQCRGPMRMRKARRGPRTGDRFWGCEAFPRCKGALNVREVSDVEIGTAEGEEEVDTETV